MVEFDVVQEFLARCERGEPIETLAAAFQKALETLGFQFFACCSHVDPANPPRGSVMYHNYPAVWTKAFSESKLYEIDPVLKFAEQTLVPFFWDAPRFHAQLTPLQREILAAGGTLGLTRGFTIPIHVPWEPDVPSASCSLVPATDTINRRSCFAAQLLVAPFYEAARLAFAPRNTLAAKIRFSRRERECLELAAQGRTDWEAGRILRISESTVRTYIERAMHRLGALTRNQAIAQALALRQIRFGDVLRSESGE